MKSTYPQIQRAFLLASLGLPLAAVAACEADRPSDSVVEVAIGSTSQALAGGIPAEGGASAEAGAPAATGSVRLHVKEIRVHIAGNGANDDEAADAAPVEAAGGGAATAHAKNGRGNAKSDGGKPEDAGKPDDTGKPEDAGKPGDAGVDPQGGPGSAPEAPGGAGWVTVFSGDRTIELSAGLQVQELLGAANAQPGRITQIRLVLASSAELVQDGKVSELSCGSCERSGLKIVPAGRLALEPGERQHVVLAFDVAQSVVDEGGALRLKPVIRLE